MADTRSTLLTQSVKGNGLQHQPPSTSVPSLFNKPAVTQVMTQVAPPLTDMTAPDENVQITSNSRSSMLPIIPSTAATGPDGSVDQFRSRSHTVPKPHMDYPLYTHKIQHQPVVSTIPTQHSQVPPPNPNPHPQLPTSYGYVPGLLPHPGMLPPMGGYYPYYPSSDLQRIPPIDQGGSSHPKLPSISADLISVPEQPSYRDPSLLQQQTKNVTPPPSQANNHVFLDTSAPAAADGIPSTEFDGRPPPKKRGRKRIEVAQVLANNDLSHCSPLGAKELEADHRRHKRPVRPQSAETSTGERQYPCTFPGCEWSFVRISDQRRHLRSHQEPLFVCPFYAQDNSCHRNGGSFTRSDVLKRHLRLVHFVQFKQSESGWCRVCEKIFPSHKFFLDHCKSCATNNKRKQRQNDPENVSNSPIEPSHQQQPHLQKSHLDSSEEGDIEPEADLELLSTASSMLAKEPGELPQIATHHEKDSDEVDRHLKRKGRSSKSSLSGSVQAGHHRQRM